MAKSAANLLISINQMGKLLFVTGNQNKVKEITAILGETIELIGLKEVGWTAEIPETTGTIKGNSLQKATTVFDELGLDCFAEDTGLEVFALNGEPGVNSARYAGANKSSEDNMDLLLDKLAGIEDRSAQFRTVITLLINEEKHFFEGICKGKIAVERQGKGGFGYDPIFIPDNYSLSFGELSPQVKNQISHRGKAVSLLIDYLKTI